MGKLDAPGAALMRVILLLAAAGAAAKAHVGSPDVFFEGKAGAYTVYVTVRTPQVIPGVAEIELRLPDPGVQAVRLTPTPLTGPGARFAPTPDAAIRSAQDPQFFTGSLWMMSSGCWQVRVQVDGSQGTGELRVPVPALARRTLEMDQALGATLAGLMAFLTLGGIAIAGAAARDGRLAPGSEPQPEHRRRGWIAVAATAALAGGTLYGGHVWSKAEASAYSRILFKPLDMKTALSGSRLTLTLEHTGWLQPRDFSDLMADHGYLMHMYVVGGEGLDRVWHLHPRQLSAGVFEQALPPMPAGQYRLFADIVHRSGLPETVVGSLELPADLAGEPLRGDDSQGALSSGLRMIREESGPVKARQLNLLKFKLVDEAGQPATSMELYLGMPAHAAILKPDGSVFAHLHPTGTVPMAAVALAQPAADPHAGHAMMGDLPAEVTFPYGFPEAGTYRMFVQMKRAGRVETGQFDVEVTP
jgi:hypothetical protein